MKDIPKILLLMSLLLSKSIQSTINMSCEPKNPFIGYLVHGGVQMFDTPTINSNRCGDEWKIYGSCCEESSLVNYAIKDKAKILEASESVWVSMTSLSAIFSSIFDHLNTKIRARGAVSEDDKQILEAISSNDLNKVITLKYNLLMVNGSIEDSFKGCWAYLSDSRSSSLCSSCSGRSRSFFEDQKMVISSESCIKMDQMCMNSFTTIVKYLDSITEIIGIVGKYKNHNGEAFFNDTGDHLLLKLSRLKKSHVHMLVNEILEIKQERKNSIPQAYKYKLCETMVNLGKAPFVVRVDHLMKSQVEFFKKLDNEIKSSTDGNVAIPDTGSQSNFPNPDTQTRNNQIFDPEDGDVKVIVNDQDVAIQQNYLLLQKLPVNLEYLLP